MTDHDMDPTQAAQITERIGQAFDFVRDAIDEPRILEHIPSGSILMFRDRMYQGHRIRLVAYLPSQPTALGRLCVRSGVDRGVRRPVLY